MQCPDEPTPVPPADAPAIDPAIQAAGTAPADAAPPFAAIDPLQQPRDAQHAADPSVANRALFEQALGCLEQLGTRRFKDRRELERIALAIAVQASAVGLSRVDRVALSRDGAGYFFVDTQAVDPALRGYVAHADAVKPEAAAHVAEAQRQQGQQQLDRSAGEVRQQQEQAQRHEELRAQQERDARDRASRNQAADQRSSRDSGSRTDASQTRAARDRADADRASADRASDRASQERASGDSPSRRI